MKERAKETEKEGKRKKERKLGEKQTAKYQEKSRNIRIEKNHSNGRNQTEKNR